MASSSTRYQSFQTDWQKTVAWAQSQGIKPSSYLPIYQKDASNLLQHGNAMSQGARTREVLTAAGMGLTQVPQDNPSPTNVIGNVQHNAWQVFTGLNPISVVKNIFDTVTNTVEHPMGEIAQPLFDVAKENTVDLFNSAKRTQDANAFASIVQGNHNALAFVPGVIDASYLTQGKAGLKHMATSPITTILDVLPIGKLSGGLVSRVGGDFAAETAARAGVTTEELKGMSAGQLAWKITKNAKLPKALGGGEKRLGLNVPTAEGVITPKYAQQTIGEFVSDLRTHFGAGAEQAQINKAIRVHEQVGMRQKIAILRPFNQAWGKLSKEQTLATNQYLTTEYHITDFRPDNVILDDPRFTPEQKDAIEQTIQLDHFITQQSLAAGELKAVMTKAGPEIYLLGPGSRARDVEVAAANMERLQQRFEAAAHQANELMDKTSEVDAIMMRFFDQVSKFRAFVHDAIADSLPDIAQGNPAYDKLTEALPGDKKPGVLGRGKKTQVAQANKKNLETFLGLDEHTEQRVYRGGTHEAEPYSGDRTQWSTVEKTAYDEAYKTLQYELRRANPGTEINPTKAQVTKLAIKRLRITNDVRDVRVHAPVSAQTAQVISDLVSKGGIIDQAVEAFDAQDWEKLRAITQVAHDKFNTKTLNSPTRSAQLAQLNAMVDGLYKYARTRANVTQKLHSLWTGEKTVTKKTKKGTLTTKETVTRGSRFLVAKKNSLAELAAQVEEANKAFLDASVHNPPAVWDNYKKIEFDRQLIAHEEGKRVVQEAVSHLRQQGMSETDLKTLQENPQIIIEMGGLSAIMSYENHVLPNVDSEVAAEINKGIEEQIFSLRQQGMKPLYLATLHPHDRIEGTGAELYNITIGKTSIRRQQSTFEKAMDTAHGTIYNFQAGMNKAVHEAVVRDHEIEFQNKDMGQFLYNRSDLEHLIRMNFVDEMRERGIIPDESGARTADYISFVNDKLAEWNLQSYDPTSIFSTGNPSVLGKGETLIDGHILDGLTKSFQKVGSNNAFIKGYDKATGVFRTSILGYSPRFTAHIVLGGTMMLAGKSSPAALLHIGDAWRMTKAFTRGETIPEDILTKIAGQHVVEDITTDKLYTHNSTQEGDADIVLQHAMGHSAAQFAIQARIAQLFGKDAADLKHPDFLTHWLKVVPEFNYRITRFSTNLQRSIAFLDGLHHAAKKDSFYVDTFDEELGKTVRVKHDMTPQQAMDEAMQHTERVMGDVRNMTPIEFNYLTRAFPFWAWSNHVLHYVLQYPGDHPYRAMFLSQMSRISAQEQPEGLPLRSQLLFFLGNPDQSGNVSAIDMRAANPLRDTASYFGISGWLSGLNPVLTAPFASVDPNITFGTNVLYPNISYSDIYGSNEANPQGTPLGTLEGIVPEVSALDSALNLSGQYAYLQKGDRNAYIKKVFESLGFPWMPQHLNLKQIAGTNELDRYNQAKKAASNFWTSGDPSQLAGYANVPDPRNADYSISAQDLINLYNVTNASIGGLGGGSVQAVTPDLKSPKY
jgi:hypothetical protein